MRVRLNAALGATLAVLVAACVPGAGSKDVAATSPAAPFVLPEGSRWLLSGSSEPVLLTPRVAIDLKVQGGGEQGGFWQGSAGCNEYRAPVAVAAEGVVRVGDPSRTKRGCEADLMRGEELFLHMLKRIVKVHGNAAQIRLETAAGDWMSFRADAGSASP